MTKEAKQEFTRRITQANKSQLITILYEMILLYLEEARTAHTEKNRPAFREAIRKIRGCINELLASLNFEYELAVNFLELYLYANRELALSDVRNSAEPLEHIRMVFEKLHASYLTLEQMDASGPVMENTQAVYAGLTYGRNDLTECLADQGAGRGFRV